MLYVMSQKFFKKNIEKMAKYNEFFNLDAENFAATGRSGDKSAIASDYSRTHSVGGFCPESRLYGMLKKKKRGEDINESKYEKEIQYYFEDKAFIASVCTAYKAVIAGGVNKPMNIFIIFPNIVYKYLGKKIVKKMQKISKLEFDSVFTQEDIENDRKCLKKLFTPDQMKEIEKRVKKIEKKFDLKYSFSNDD